MQLEDLDLSTKRVNIGALNVIGGFSGTSVDDIKTAIVSTLGATQSLSSSMKAFIADIMDDGMISPIEKKQLKRELALIQNEFPIICTKALEAGVPEADPVMIAYTEAYEGLYGYLYNELKVFDDMSAFTVVADTAEFEAHFTTYYAARDEVETSITDGLLLEALNTVAADIEDVNQRIDDVRNGDVIDGVIARSKLESGLQTEISQVSSAIFPNGLDRQNTFELLTPRVVLNEDMADYLLSLIGEQEEMVEVRANEIRLVSAQADSDRTRISSLEIDLDSITQIVAELTPLADGQIANLTQIAQNASAIELLATTGRYDTGSGEVDSYSLAQMNLLADRFELFVGGSGDDFDAATWKVTQDQIGSLVQNAIETDDELIANISQMVQAADSVQFQVAQLRTETIERVDEALMLAQGGMLITATEIQLGVQNLEDELQSLLSIQAGQISALVQDVAKNSSSILSLKSEQIAAMVRGGGAEAYLALSVTLPATIDADLRNTMITAVGAAAVNEIYVLTTSGYWYVSPDATSVALKTLKNGLRAAGLLGSQIALDADEILMGGKVRAEHINVDELVADGGFINSLVSSEGFIDSLTVKKLAIDANPESELDFEVNIDEQNGILVKRLGSDIFRISPDGDPYFKGSGEFTGAVTADSFSSTQVIISGLQAGNEIIKSHPGYAPAFTGYNGMVHQYLNIQICASGTIRLKFNWSFIIYFTRLYDGSVFSSLSLRVYRLNNQLKTKTQVWYKTIIVSDPANVGINHIGSVDLNIAIAEGDSFLFDACCFGDTGYSDGRTVMVPAECYHMHYTDVSILSSKKPGILSWIGVMSNDSDYISLNR